MSKLKKDLNITEISESKKNFADIIVEYIIKQLEIQKQKESELNSK
ncbi:MAG: hypothetical protein Q4G05_01560 [Clostridia bacterium]|nr:hypothetical protein [Clostridia bacterium]